MPILFDEVDQRNCHLGLGPPFGLEFRNGVKKGWPGSPDQIGDPITVFPAIEKSSNHRAPKAVSANSATRPLALDQAEPQGMTEETMR